MTTMNTTNTESNQVLITDYIEDEKPQSNRLKDESVKTFNEINFKNPTIEDELAWEKYVANNAQLKILEGIKKTRAKGGGANTHGAMRFMSNSINEIAERIDSEIVAAKLKRGKTAPHLLLIESLNDDDENFITSGGQYAATIAMTTCISALINQKEDDSSVKLTSLAIDVGTAVMAEWMIRYVVEVCDEENSDEAKRLFSSLEDNRSTSVNYRARVFKRLAKKKGLLDEAGYIKDTGWDLNEKVKLGMYLLSRLAGKCAFIAKESVNIIDPEGGMIQIYTDFDKSKTVYKVTLTPEVIQWINTSDETHAAGSVNQAPTLIPPMNWEYDSYNKGGFYSVHMTRKVNSWLKYHNEEIRIIHEQTGSDNTKVIDMINYNQNIPWSINKFMFETIDGLVKRNVFIAGVNEPCEEKEPVKPAFHETKEKEEFTDVELKQHIQWKRDQANYMKVSAKTEDITKRRQGYMIAAKPLLEAERFYFVYQVDSRGRLYPASGLVNPQGCDLQKSLLHAAEGEPIDTPEAEFFYRLSFAGKYGVDKLSLQDSADWILQNEEMIIKAGTDPFDEDALEFWLKADKPFQFLACCNEWVQYRKFGKEFKSRITVDFDGSNNALQHISAVIRDENGGKSVNLAPSEVPNDVYGDAAKILQAKMENDCNSSDKNIVTAAHKWLPLINRKLTKTTTMTKSYGVKKLTVYDHVRDFLKEYHPDDLFTAEETTYCGTLLWDSVNETVQRGVELMDYYVAAAGAIIKGVDTKSIDWKTPTGFNVVQEYLKKESKKIVCTLGITVRPTVRVENPDEVDLMRHKNGVVANVIHSFDAAHMTLTCERFTEGFSKSRHLHLVHDSYGCLAKHAPTLFSDIRLTFVDMYSEFDGLSIFDKYKEMGVELPEKPKTGTLDLLDVLASDHFFR